MIKIAHIADLQVKNREKNLYIPYSQSLDEISSILEFSGASIVVIAGDLFEYANPTESERKLIYNFLSDLATLKSIENIIIIAGNHDLEKSKKSQQISDSSEDIIIGHNALNVFIDLLKHLDTEARDKFTYMNDSKIYSNPYINLLGYSLEDGMNIGNPIFDDNLPIVAVYHAMIKEYVDSVKLPIRKDIYQNLMSVEEFPENSIIMAGDIHENLHFKGSANQNFYYPGSIQQHTHNEGQFTNIGEEVIITKSAESKGINFYDIIDRVTYSQYREVLKNYVFYHTIKLDITQNYDVIKKSLLKFLSSIEQGVTRTFIKVKSSNVFASKERDIFETINKYVPNSRISFEYDKLIQSINTVSNNAVKSVIQSVINDSENNDEIDETTPLTPDNIDTLTLSNEQVIRLFANTAQEQINKVLNTDISEDLDIKQAKTDLITLFTQQLENISGNNKKYSLEFKDIYCNQFMALGENHIDLDKPGLTRILGTNGIGKTTLFRMIRWILTGEVFDNMKSNTVSKNNMIIFNKDLIDSDTVIVKMNLTNNGVPVLLERWCVRKWKNNTTDEQKYSLNWKDYVSTIDRNIRFVIRPGEPEQKVIIGDNAETNIKLWIGQAVDNILLINQSKIDSLLKTSGQSLNEMVLSFIGVDYINKLEDNLDNVKMDLMRVSKPTISKDDIKDNISKNLHNLKEKESELKSIINNDLNKIEKNIQDLNNELSIVNDDLIKLGDIPLKINEREKEISKLTEDIDSFQIKEKLVEKTIDVEKPILSDEKISAIDNEISNIIDITNNLEKYKTSKDLEISETKVLLQKEIESKISECDIKISNITDIISNLNIKQTDIINNIRKDFSDNKKILLSEKNKITDEYNTVKNLFDNCINAINIFKDSIKKGYCPTCNRPFDDNFEDHKKEIESKIFDLNESSKKYEISIKDSYNNILKLDREITNITKNEDLINSGNICDIDSYDIEKSHYNMNSIDICKNSDLLDKLKYYITTFKNLAILIENNVFTKADGVTSEMKKYLDILNQLALDKLDIADEILKNNDNKKLLETEISTIKDSFNKKLNEYYEYVSEIQEYNSHVTEENNNIDNHNSQLHIIEQTLEDSKFKLDIETHTLLPQYNLLMKNKSEVSDKILTQNKELKSINDNITTLSVNIESLKNSIAIYNQKYEDYLKYESDQFIWKIYSKVIKNNFKSIIFEYYRVFLNNTLNDLLDDMNFKLFWNTDSELFMMSINNGEVTYIPVNQASGMESIFNGLALIYTISILNVKNSMSHILIDELSGQLSKGDTLSYDARNYQDLFTRILHKFDNKSIFIVDHNIDNMNETTTYEVRSGEKGSKYVEI